MFNNNPYLPPYVNPVRDYDTYEQFGGYKDPTMGIDSFRDRDALSTMTTTAANTSNVSNTATTSNQASSGGSFSLNTNTGTQTIYTGYAAVSTTFDYSYMNYNAFYDEYRDNGYQSSTQNNQGNLSGMTNNNQGNLSGMTNNNSSGIGNQNSNTNSTTAALNTNASSAGLMGRR